MSKNHSIVDFYFSSIKFHSQMYTRMHDNPYAVTGWIIREHNITTSTWPRCTFDTRQKELKLVNSFINFISARTFSIITYTLFRIAQHEFIAITNWFWIDWEIGSREYKHLSKYFTSFFFIQRTVEVEMMNVTLDAS